MLASDSTNVFKQSILANIETWLTPSIDGMGNVMPDRMCKTTRQKMDAKYNTNKKCRYDGVRS